MLDQHKSDIGELEVQISDLQARYERQCQWLEVISKTPEQHPYAAELEEAEKVVS